MANYHDEPDRYWRNDDGQIFEGYDDGEGRTDWYDSNGDLDCVTDTPDEWEQAMNDDGY
ncbi:hypothetical protein QYZ88_010295 [Lachnospiraceae bacterium C1.1]|nr:hypothetical protein [Lachnospiraceae bacterium C1.1]